MGKPMSLACTAKPGIHLPQDILSCSDMSETIVANQDKYGGSWHGLLIECTYIADGTDAEFTFDAIYGSDWHLYAFSNREATSMPAAPTAMEIGEITLPQ